MGKRGWLVPPQRRRRLFKHNFESNHLPSCGGHDIPHHQPLIQGLNPLKAKAQTLI